MTTIRHQSNDPTAARTTDSRQVIATPSAQTRAVLRGLSCWQAPTAPAVRTRVFPEPVLPVIIDLGGPGWFLESPIGERGPQAPSLGVGLHQRFGVLHAPAAPSCVLLELDPIGAFKLFGVPLHELSDQTFDLVDILGAGARELRERLESSRTPVAALDVADHFVAERLRRAKEPCPAIAWTWQTLLASSGNVSIDALAKNVGWSRKHLRQRFLEQVGASPKAAAQLIRFSAALRVMRTSRLTGSLAATAADLGYFDQAHMCRAFRRHAGCTPTRFRDVADATGAARVENTHR